MEIKAFKKIEGAETVPQTRRNEVMTTVYTLQFCSEIISLFTLRMGNAFIQLISGDGVEGETSLASEGDSDEDNIEIIA